MQSREYWEWAIGSQKQNIGEIRPYFERMPHIFVNTKEMSK